MCGRPFGGSVRAMRTLICSLVITAAACGGSSGSDLPSGVSEHIDDGDSATEISPGVYERESDGLLLGECAVVKPYVEEHGKPDGFLCSD